ncbi:hypothetical protein DHD32_14145 [Arenibacter sp. TNZ]|nr:hypothetical protein [Arenibacter sp. TNZ]
MTQFQGLSHKWLLKVITLRPRPKRGFLFALGAIPGPRALRDNPGGSTKWYRKVLAKARTFFVEQIPIEEQEIVQLGKATI